jgi:dTDP-4-amino-4,6-dideoxygalactose transaminase
MKVPLVDLKAQYRTLKAEMDAAIMEVIESQDFILGPKVRECEDAIARYTRCSFAVGVSSGTDALLICLMAEEIGAGDEVITTPFTFFATVGSIVRTGAKPVFVDIDPVTYNIDPAQIERKITSRTRAIIPVHLYGQMADMARIIKVAKRHGLLVIEDAAQAIGAEHGGQRAGSLGDYGCFSFFPSKNLGAGGDGGMVVTNNAERADKLRCLRSHGSKTKNYHKLVGGNFRLDTLQAALVLVKLKHLDAWNFARQHNATRYARLFSEAGVRTAETALRRKTGAVDKSRTADWDNGMPEILLPSVVTDRAVFHQYVIRVPGRDQLKVRLDQKGVGNGIYYPVPIHLQECFACLKHSKGDFPESENAARETLALPIYPELREEQARFVVECIRDWLANKTGDEPLHMTEPALKASPTQTATVGANCEAAP